MMLLGTISYQLAEKKQNLEHKAMGIPCQPLDPKMPQMLFPDASEVYQYFEKKMFHQSMQSHRTTF